MPHLKRKPWKRTKRHLSLKKPRRAKIDLWREWLVPDNAYHRYEGLRGIYWYWLSRDVRKSEWERWEKKCLTCQEEIPSWQEGDCGHILPAANCGEYLRFNRRNLTIQHKKCNNPRFTSDAGIRNAVNYDKRFGIGSMSNLLDLKQTDAKEPKTAEYKTLISSLSSYQEALKAL